MVSLNATLNKILLILLVLAGFLFPLFISPLATDPFILPKQALILGVVLLALALSAVKLLIGGEIKLRRTPFDLPLLGLVLVLLLSSFLSINRADSLIFTVTFLSLAVFYYLLVNLLREEHENLLFVLALLLGGALSSVILILSFAKIYPLSFLFHPAQSQLVQNPAFNPLGNLLAAAAFFLLVIPLGFGLASSAYSQKKTAVSSFSLTLIIIIGFGFLLAVYQLATSQKPLLLPQEFGLQAATGAIGQNFQTLLFGSGPATFLTDFTRFRSVTFNNLPFWNTIFFSSSSLFLELLATTGMAGVGFFLFLLLSVLRTFKIGAGVQGDRAHLGLFASLVVFAGLSFILPVGWPLLFLFFVFLALYTNSLSRIAPELVYETKILVVPSHNVFSLFLVGLVAALVGIGAFFGGRFLTADVKFQKSLVAASENRGLETYNLQLEAVNLSPYRDGFRRVFSQTNLALANGLSQDIRSRNASPSAQEQQTIVTLVQQAITNARAAAGLSPQNFLNWDNLAGIYRSLVGFGQNAEVFAASSLQQAISLYPTNLQLYLSLGGTFYQLGQWDNAQRQFEVAVRLKPDFANSYYNLGHALENKGDLQGALLQYQTVEALLARDAKDSENYKRIVSEIGMLQERIKKEGATVAAVLPPIPPGQAGTRQEPLQVSTPSATLPRQEPKVEIPPPTEATESAK